jgi:thiamine pyrophosphate-dependent acetolactate synthase large subunit-like protein
MAVEEMRSEIVGSRIDLENRVGAHVELCAYPYGADTADFRRLVEDAGFPVACSTRAGEAWPAPNPYALERVSARGGDSLMRFAVMLWLGLRVGDRSFA